MIDYIRVYKFGSGLSRLGYSEELLIRVVIRAT